LEYHPGMIDVTEIFYLIFGILTIIGGVIGFLKARSRISLIAGTICGAALLAAWYLVAIHGSIRSGLILGLVISIALGGQFVPKVIGNRAAPHTVVMAVLSGISLLLSIFALTVAK